MVGVRTTSKYWKLYSLKIKIVFQINDEISELLIAVLGFKDDRAFGLLHQELPQILVLCLGFTLNLLWRWISILYNHVSVHIRRAISHSHMTYAETVPSWFLLNLKVVKELHETYYKS